MATIAVYKKDTNIKLGSGTGTRNAAASTASISSWTNQAGLKAGTHYKLTVDRATYTDCTCDSVDTNDPVATFSNVS